LNGVTRRVLRTRLAFRYTSDACFNLTPGGVRTILHIDGPAMAGVSAALVAAIDGVFP